MDYKDKYLKYKTKYLQLKLNNQKGGNKRKIDLVHPSQQLYLKLVLKEGNDGNIYIIVTNKNGVKRWKLHKKMEIKKLNKKISLTKFYDIDVIKPKKLNDYK